MEPRAWKLPEDEFWLGVDFDEWPLSTGETIVASNSRGTLTVTVYDYAGQDVTGELTDGAPQIDGTGQTVLTFIRGGVAPSTYQLQVLAPTSDDELLSAIKYLDVRSTP